MFFAPRGKRAVSCALRGAELPASRVERAAANAFPEKLEPLLFVEFAANDPCLGKAANALALASDRCALLEGSRLPLTKWVLAIGLLRVGISARALARELAVSRQTAWELLHRLRDALRRDVLARKLRGRIEVDETYIGGRQKGKRGRGAAHKSVVIGLKVRKGRVRSLIIPSVATAEIQRILKAHVAKGARLYTDEFSSYRKVRSIGFRHRRVAHSRRFVRGQTHTQSIEGHWGHVKPTLVARHRSVSPAHLQRYLIEADFKHRLPEDTDLIALVLHCLLAPQSALPNY